MGFCAGQGERKGRLQRGCAVRMNVLFTEHFRDYSFVAVALWTDMRAALSLEPHPSLQVYSWPYAPPPEDMDTDAIFHMENLKLLE